MTLRGIERKGGGEKASANPCNFISISDTNPLISLKRIRITPSPVNLRSFLSDVNKSGEQPAEMAATQQVLAEKSSLRLVLGQKRGISIPVPWRVVWSNDGI